MMVHLVVVMVPIVLAMVVVMTVSRLTVEEALAHPYLEVLMTLLVMEHIVIILFKYQIT